MGAAGRDFHNFNVYFRDNENMILLANGYIESDEEIVVNYRHHTDTRKYYE